MGYAIDPESVTATVTGTVTVTGTSSVLVVNTTGSAVPIVFTLNTTTEDPTAEGPVVIAQPYQQAIAEGRIIGHSPFFTAGVALSATDQDIDVWELNTAYVFPTVAQAMHVVSTSTQDASAGTGAKIVKLDYLDASYVQHSELVTMNGTTNVTTTNTNIFRVNACQVTSWGTALKPVGTITVKNTADSVTYSNITAGFNRARSCIYTVPAGKTLYLTSVAASIMKSSQGQYGRFILRANYDNLDGSTLTVGAFMPLSEFGLMDGGFVRAYEVPIKIPATCDVKLSCIPGQTATILTGAIRGWTE